MYWLVEAIKLWYIACNLVQYNVCNMKFKINLSLFEQLLPNDMCLFPTYYKKGYEIYSLMVDLHSSSFICSDIPNDKVYGTNCK